MRASSISLRPPANGTEIVSESGCWRTLPSNPATQACPISGPSASMAAWATTAASCRTLPGQSYRSRDCHASSEKRHGSCVRGGQSTDTAAARKCSASAGCLPGDAAAVERRSERRSDSSTAQSRSGSRPPQSPDRTCWRRSPVPAPGLRRRLPGFGRCWAAKRPATSLGPRAGVAPPRQGTTCRIDSPPRGSPARPRLLENNPTTVRTASPPNPTRAAPADDARTARQHAGSGDESRGRSFAFPRPSRPESAPVPVPAIFRTRSRISRMAGAAGNDLAIRPRPPVTRTGSVLQRAGRGCRAGLREQRRDPHVGAVRDDDRRRHRERGVGDRCRG